MSNDIVYCELEHCVYSNVLFCASAILPPGKLALTRELLDELEAELRSSCLEAGINLQFTQEGLTGTGRLMRFISTFDRIMRTNELYPLEADDGSWMRVIIVIGRMVLTYWVQYLNLRLNHANERMRTTGCER